MHHPAPRSSREHLTGAAASNPASSLNATLLSLPSSTHQEGTASLLTVFPLTALPPSAPRDLASASVRPQTAVLEMWHLVLGPFTSAPRAPPTPFPTPLDLADYFF